MAILNHVGPGEILLLLFVALMVFGAKRLPEMGRSMGRSLREFKAGVKGMVDDDDDVPPRVNGAKTLPSGDTLAADAPVRASGDGQTAATQER